jgi:hypothetical protein
MVSSSNTLTDTLTTIYAELLSRQEPLGADFDKALFENIEELYKE